VGQPVTFTAMVTCPGFTPTGTVTFKDGATTLGTGTLNGAGTASFTTSSLTPGTHGITTAYSGDANCSASTSPALTQVVNPAVAGTTLASSANPSTPGQPVTFTATVTCPGFTPTGTVTFNDGATTPGTDTLNGAGTVTIRASATTLGSGTLNGAGTASFTTSSLSTGTHSITAVYSGDANCAAGTSAALSEQLVGVAAAVLPVLPFDLGGSNNILLGSGGITVNGCGSVTDQAAGGPSLLLTLLPVGQTVFPYAVPCAGWSFTGWTGGGPGCDGKQDNPCIIVVPPTGVSLTAMFVPIK
jgi:hypothetical protein